MYGNQKQKSINLFEVNVSGRLSGMLNKYSKIKDVDDTKLSRFKSNSQQYMKIQESLDKIENIQKLEDAYGVRMNLQSYNELQKQNNDHSQIKVEQVNEPFSNDYAMQNL